MFVCLGAGGCGGRRVGGEVTDGGVEGWRGRGVESHTLKVSHKVSHKVG